MTAEKLKQRPQQSASDLRRMRLNFEFIPNAQELRDLLLPQSPLNDLRAELLDE